MQLFEIGFARDISLVLSSGVIFYTLLYAFYLIMYWARSPIRNLIDVRTAFAVFLFGLAANTFCFAVTDVTPLSDTAYLYWTKLGYACIMVAVSGFSLALEKILPYKTRYLFTVAGLLITIMVLFVPQTIMRILSYGFAANALILLVLFFRYFKAHTTPDTKLGYHLLTFGVLIGFTGFIFRNDLVFEALGPEFYSLGILLLLIGVVMFGGSILDSPAYDELDWNDQLQQLYVIGEGGILLFNHNFHASSGVDESLAAAGISGVQDVFREITKTEEGFKRVSIGNNELLFSQGSDVVTALVANAAYSILLEKLRDFTEKFELLFRDRIQQRNRPVTGEIAALLLVENVFSQE